MLKDIDWRAAFTGSIRIGLITIVSIVIIMILSGFVVALYSKGESMLVAARTLTYPILPYVLFVLVGFAVFHSSRRTAKTALMFNICAIVFFVSMVSILLLGVLNMNDVIIMWKDVLIQNFVLSMVLVVVFFFTTFIREPVLEVAKRNAK